MESVLFADLQTEYALQQKTESTMRIRTKFWSRKNYLWVHLENYPIG